jgi:tripartite ATP-independent transporter DctM subunit
MGEIAVGGTGVAILVLMIAFGVNIFVALGLVGSVGLLVLSGFAGATANLSTIFYNTSSSFHFSVIPMFLLMGYFAMHAGLGRDLFIVAVRWLGRLPGGLVIATTAAAAAFGAASGSSVATTLLFTKLALPEMVRHGYDRRFAAASIAISGTLAVLIPPSALIVIYAILTNVSIGKLLLAGVIPGIVFAVVLCLFSLLIAVMKPALAPRIQERFTRREKIRSLRHVGPLALMVGAIVVGLYYGVFTPTEAGAVAAAISFVVAIVRQRGVRNIQLKQALLDTVQMTAMIFGIIICALIFSRFLAFSGLSSLIGTFLTTLEVNRWVVLAIVTGIYLILGMLMDAPAMLAVTLPVIEPAMRTLGFDPIWFGIFVVVLCELGAITPPVGINCFVISATARDLVTLEQVFAGVLPYVFACLAMLVVLCIFPQLALYLPNGMN